MRGDLWAPYAGQGRWIGGQHTKVQTLEDRQLEMWVESNGRFCPKVSPSYLQKRVGYERGNYTSKTIGCIHKGQVGKSWSLREKAYTYDPEDKWCNAGRPESDMQLHAEFSTKPIKEG